MKFFVLLVVIAAARAGLIYAPGPRPLETGASVQHRNQDVFGNYNFGYNEDHTTGGTFRRESGDAFGNKVGSYGLRDADGRHRVVNYVADAAGFRADIQTNEPGTAPQDTAAATVNKGVVLAAPAPVVAAYTPHAVPHAAHIPYAVRYAAHIPHAVPHAAVAYTAPAVHYAAPIGHHGAVTHHVAPVYHGRAYSW